MRLPLSLVPGRRGYVQGVTGQLDIDGMVKSGDGLKIIQQETATLQAHGSAEVLLFDLP